MVLIFQIAAGIVLGWLILVVGGKACAALFRVCAITLEKSGGLIDLTLYVAGILGILALLTAAVVHFAR